MPGIDKYNSPAKVQRIGNDSVYGVGTDGDVVIVANISLSRDMYYNNLTINSNCHLNTNGFKVFVKGTLTLDGNLGVASGTTVSTATLRGTAPIASNTIGSLGGNAAGSTYIASQAPSYVLNALENIIFGGYVDSNSAFIAFSGGAGGEDGVEGGLTLAADGTGAGGAPTSWPGQPGSLPGRNIGAAGGPGTQGDNGSNGVKGTDVPAAIKGDGGIGGAVVLICAKSITGSGVIKAQGSNATVGGSIAVGSGATLGNVGNTGTTAPAASIAHYTQNHAHYISGDGTHGPTISIGSSGAYPLGLPHSGHTPATYAPHAHGTWAYTVHDATPVHPHNHHHGSNPHHGVASTGHAPVGADASFFHQNGIDHTAGGQLGHSGAVAHNVNTTTGPLGHNHYHEADAHHVVGAKGSHITHASRARHDLHGQHHQGRARIGGPTAHVGHRTYPGGVGGPGGSAGSSGTNGSTTAGTNGKSGGGGGIIIVTDSATPISATTNVSGGSVGGVSANGGSVITIINS